MMKNVRKQLFSGLLVLMLMVGMFCVPVDAADSDTSNTRGYEDEEGVALVYTEYYGSDSYSMGTAFGIGTIGENTDTFVTNKHVVTDANDNWAPAKNVYLVLDEGIVGEEAYFYYDKTGTPQFLDYSGIDTSKMVKCNVIYVSEEWDFAIIQAESTVDRVALELASSGTAKSVPIRTEVYAIGYPALSEEFSNEDFGEPVDWDYYGYQVYRSSYSYGGRIEDATTTDGKISKRLKVASLNDVWSLQHTATVNPGNSGGPLVTNDGLVLGINTYQNLETESMNYAIYIDYVLEYLDQAGIPYNITNTHETDNEVSTDEVSTNEAGSSFPWVPIIIALAVVVIAVIAVFVVMYMRKQPGTAKASYGPNHAQASTSANTSGHQFNAAAQGGNKQVRYCPYCGSPLNGDAKFCGNCGKKLS